MPRKEWWIMYKEIIISIVIIIGIFVLNYITTNYTTESLDSMFSGFAEMRPELLKDNQEKELLSKKAEELISNWNNKTEKLAYYIEHDELEKVNTYLVGLKANIDSEDYEQAVENLDICGYILEHIDDKEAFLIKNIF